MRVKKSAIFGFVLGCLILSVPVQGVVVIEPTIVKMPGSTGETFSFEYAINDAAGTTALAYQSTISVSGPGTLTFDVTGSEAVVVDNTSYWIYGNSLDVGATDLGGGVYEFADTPDDPATEALLNGDVMARYAFAWEGTVGDYTFTLDLDTDYSFVYNASTWNADALALPDPASQWWAAPIISADDTSFTVHIPEPSTMVLLALGGAGLLKRRRR
jgi:outer membrane lipoprotein-sorting protein